MRRSPLHELNSRLGARFVDFGGWEMPLQYESVLAEHRAVRSTGGWFDVSHLGRFSIRGASARIALRRLLTNDIDALAVGRTQYTLMLNEQGGIEDDLLVWRWGDERFWVLPNAATHDMVLARFREAAAGAEIVDLRETTAMVAVQGPAMPGLLTDIVGRWPKRFTTDEISEGDDSLRVAGTGYTGERGGEVVGDPSLASNLVERLLAAGVTPCGLGARDTLRLEAGLLLAGQDFGPSTNPYEAGLETAISWDHDFVGSQALAEVREEGPSRKLVAFTLPGRKIPRHGYRLRAGDSVGEVTSGNFSPMLEKGIGLGYLAPPPGDEPLEVEIRGVWEAAERAELPFYRQK
jgi:aminomethyltransferase